MDHIVSVLHAVAKHGGGRFMQTFLSDVYFFEIYFLRLVELNSGSCLMLGMWLFAGF
jgi:hypothetical protein